MLPTFPADTTIESLVYSHLRLGRVHPLRTHKWPSIATANRLMRNNPCGFHADAIAREMCGGVMSGSELLDKHSLFHFLTCRTNLERKHHLYAAMLVGETHSQAKLAGVTRQLYANSIRKRLCLGCVQDDYLNYGMAYWRRSHILPFQARCTEHRTPLIASCSSCGEEVDIAEGAFSPSPECLACGAPHRASQVDVASCRGTETAADFCRELAAPTDLNLDPRDDGNLILRSVRLLKASNKSFTDFSLDLWDVDSVSELTEKIAPNDSSLKVQALLRYGRGYVTFGAYLAISATAARAIRKHDSEFKSRTLVTSPCGNASDLLRSTMQEKSPYYDPSTFPIFECGHVLPPKISSAQVTNPDLRGALTAAIYMASQIELAQGSSHLRIEQIRNAYFRAALAELIRVEDIVKALGAHFRFNETHDPLLHAVKVLRSYQAHVGVYEVQAGATKIQYAGENHVFETYIVDNLSCQKLRELDSASQYSDEQLNVLTKLFDAHQRKLGIVQLLYNTCLHVGSLLQKA